MRQLLKELLTSFKVASVAFWWLIGLFSVVTAIAFLAENKPNEFSASIVLAAVLFYFGVDVLLTMQRERGEEKDEDRN